METVKSSGLKAPLWLDFGPGAGATLSLQPVARTAKRLKLPIRALGMEEHCTSVRSPPFLEWYVKEGRGIQGRSVAVTVG